MQKDVGENNTLVRNYFSGVSQNLYLSLLAIKLINFLSIQHFLGVAISWFKVTFSQSFYPRSGKLKAAASYQKSCQLATHLQCTMGFHWVSRDVLYNYM